MSITFSATVILLLLVVFLGSGAWIFSGLMLVPNYPQQPIQRCRHP